MEAIESAAEAPAPVFTIPLNNPEQAPEYVIKSVPRIPKLLLVIFSGPLTAPELIMPVKVEACAPTEANRIPLILLYLMLVEVLAPVFEIPLNTFVALAFIVIF